MFGVLNLVAMIIAIIFIPGQFNLEIVEEEEENLLENNKAKRTDVTWKDILTNKHSNYAIVACFFGMFSIQFFLGFFADELIDLGLPANSVGYVYGCESLVYFLMCLIYPYVFEHWPRKITFVFAFFGFALCEILIGPSQALDLPHDYRLMLCGCPIMGFFQTFVFIPIIPEMLEHL